MKTRKLAQSTLDIIEYSLKNPCVKPVRIAEIFGLERERIRQIRKRGGLKTTALNYGQTVRCPKCGGRKHGNANLCGQCWKDSLYIQVACDECGRLHTRLVSRFLMMIRRGQELFFCNGSCRSRYTGNYYGFGAHPENIAKRG